MKRNKTYRSLLDKSIASMLAAIEIYNKPNFSYREDTFSILCVNAWELLLKAVWFKINHYKLNSIYEMVNKKKKDGTKSLIKTPALNRALNPKTISVQRVIELLRPLKIIDSNLENNIWSLIELRDNAVHFTNPMPITKQIQELGFAAINNYLSFIKNNQIEIDISEYNFYLMPLAYVNSKIDVEGVLTEPVQNYLDFIMRCVNEEDKDAEYQIAVSIDVKFQKGASLQALGVKYSQDGIPITIKEEDIKKRFPLSHRDIMNQCARRYVDFKANNRFHSIMKVIKADDKLTHERKLDADNPKSPKKCFYSTNVWKVFDKEYTKKA